jgi:quercetin dioxygenase-like cupin family protein
MTKYKPMHNKIIFVLLLVIFLVRTSIAQEPLPTAEKYTFENCINKFDMNKTVKTSAGYQYWFIEQKFLDDNLTVKMSVVAPKQATHAPHKHPGDETFFILEGTAQFYLNGKTTTGGPLTSFYCPVGSEHGISNAGDTELKYLVIRKYVE